MDKYLNDLPECCKFNAYVQNAIIQPNYDSTTIWCEESATQNTPELLGSV